MSVAPGTRIGPYEVVVLIGVGGMGEVYRATDTNLGRQVAIKVLPEAFASDPERLARFEREAKTLAALNHPNIAIIHGLERADGIQALVMELVAGPTLADRIAQGPIPVEEALPIAKQIAEALEAAHEQGIIHRDLKPANIKLRPDGTVKVLDFGLAKALEPRSLTGIDATASPTITSPAMMTGVGMLLGTAAYMSPEQAKGRAADKRSDVWAFGCVLYEMLAGRRAFDAEDVSDTFALVLKGEPDWTTLPADLPWLVSVFIHQCLEKDRRKRIADISTALFVLDQAGRVLSEPQASWGQKNATSVAIPLWRRAIPVVLAAVLAGVVVGIAAWRLQPVMPAAAVTRFAYSLPEGQAFTDAFLPSVAISPDGTQMAYVANQRLYLRSMSELEAKPIPGTETETNMGSPVFSPDGRAIAYWTRTGPPAGRLTGIPGALRRIATTGGASVTIGQVDNIPLGLRWDRDAVLFGQVDHGIMHIPATGGTPEVLLKGKTGEATLSPQLLPGGEAVLFTLATSEDGTVTFQQTWEQAQIVVQSLKSGERKTLITGGSDARYLPTGHLVYALGGVLFAVPFDVKRLAVTGGPVPVVEGVLRTGLGPVSTGSGHFSISDSGSIIYVPGPTSGSSDARDLVLVDRSGRIEPLKLPSRSYHHPRASPNGRQVAFFTDDGNEAIVWMYDLSGENGVRRLTLEGKNCCPIWSPDGQRVAFQSNREGDAAIFWQRADGGTPAERLTKPEKGSAHVPESWSRDGLTMLFTETRGSTSSLWMLSMKDRTTTQFASVQSSATMSSDFSPDGRWVTYMVRGASMRSSQVFVQPYPNTGAKYLVADNAARPQWAPDGKELFFWRLNQVFAVSVTPQSGFTFGNPRPLPVFFALAPAQTAGATVLLGRETDVMPDGQRFISVVQQFSTAGTPRIQVVLNLFEELKRRVPAN